MDADAVKTMEVKSRRADDVKTVEHEEPKHQRADDEATRVIRERRRHWLDPLTGN